MSSFYTVGEYMAI